MSNSLSLLFAALRGGSKAQRKFVYAPYSKVNFLVCKIFYDAGYISSFFVSKHPHYFVSQIGVQLKYLPSGFPMLEDLTPISSSAYRRYITYKNLLRLWRSKRKNYLLRTSKGFMWLHEALFQRRGGELVCSI